MRGHIATVWEAEDKVLTRALVPDVPGLTAVAELVLTPPASKQAGHSVFSLLQVRPRSAAGNERCGPDVDLGPPEEAVTCMFLSKGKKYKFCHGR